MDQTPPPPLTPAPFAPPTTAAAADSPPHTTGTNTPSQRPNPQSASGWITLPSQPAAVSSPSPGHHPDSGSGESDDDFDEEQDQEQEEDEDEDDHVHTAWRHIEEDNSVPCDDELKYIKSKNEHSALEHAYWEKRTFFEMDDPEITTVASGRIDWVIDPFNGTKDKPNTADLMRSPIVHIGDHDCRIKFFPHGDGTNFLSAYLECVTMQQDEFVEFEDFEAPPFPILSNLDASYNSMLKKRRSIAVQFALLMYNPDEPRVYEYKSDAHQFHKRSADCGFRYFSGDSRYDFHIRKHGQRRAILQNDKLALSAYVRVVHDPTNCLWQRVFPWSDYDNSVITTGLRPFRNLWPQMPAAAALFHFVPFRDFLRRSQHCTRQVHALQEWLLKFYSRRHSPCHGQITNFGTSDAVTILRNIARALRTECDATKVTEVIGHLDPERGSAIASNRLKTKTYGSVQMAVDHHPTHLETPQLLTLELERQEFDPKHRKWSKITNKVSLDNKIHVNNQKYVLYAFGTHIGELESNKHKAYIRPGGPGGLWFAYEDGRVTSMTSKQALESRCGYEERKCDARRDSPFSGFSDTQHENEAAYVVMYVRDDTKDRAFGLPKSELWDPPELIKTMQGFPGKKADHTSAAPAPLCPNHNNFGFSSNGAPEGSATPPWPLMDGEDVIMSDSEDDPACAALANSYIIATNATSNGVNVSVGTITVDALGQDWYHGQVLNNERHGQGHLVRSNGDEYTGEFQHGKPHGRGKMVYARNGDIYEGAWKDGEHHGHGDLTEFSTGNTYSGGWKGGRKHGDFVLRGTVTEEDRGCCTICYDHEITTAFYDCGHVVACKECASAIESCPVCRKTVVARLQLYGVKMVLA